jgi:hypothetical protein
MTPVEVLLEIALFLLIALPVPILLVVGFNSLNRFKQHAKSVMDSTQPVKMSLTKIQEQSLWFNSKHSPGYRINLTPTDSGHAAIEGLKIDPSDEPAHDKWAAICKKLTEESGDGAAAAEKQEVADVYFDSQTQPVAVSVDGAVAWKAGWLGDS